MSVNSKWTIIFDDKSVINQTLQIGYEIKDDAFWSQEKFSNIWAIQYVDGNNQDEVEYRDETPHTSFTEANIGNISDFTSKFDQQHLLHLQEKWDNAAARVEDPEGSDNWREATTEEKISFIGPRPTSYTS